MIATDRSAWICDLAETYGIYDYRSLPLRTVATLSAGLRYDSRIKCKMRGVSYDIGILIGCVYDRLTDILMVLGAYDKRPESMISMITGSPDEKDAKKAVRSFATPEEFEAALRKFEAPEVHDGSECRD